MVKKLRKSSGSKRILAPGTALNDDLLIVDHLGGSRKVDIYLCRSKRHEGHVACKVLREKYASHESSVKAIWREGRILRHLRHPNIVKGYDVDLTPTPHIVMQRLHGQTLDTAILQGNQAAFESEEFVDVALQLADALTYVHASGLLHLDLKPSNIMYDDGHVTLFDFSVARSFAPGTDLRTGVGTRDYKSPEQDSQNGAGYHSDMFSLGVVFYRLLTGGEKPFPSIDLKIGEEGKTKRVLDYAADVRPPAELNSAVTDVVSEVAMRAIHPDLKKRFATPSEFKSALEVASRSESRSLTI